MFDQLWLEASISIAEDFFMSRSNKFIEGFFNWILSGELSSCNEVVLMLVKKKCILSKRDWIGNKFFSFNWFSPLKHHFCITRADVIMQRQNIILFSYWTVWGFQIIFLLHIHLSNVHQWMILWSASCLFSYSSFADHLGSKYRFCLLISFGSIVAYHFELITQ